jgi:NRPS condensation-like uncharacterized protein
MASREHGRYFELSPTDRAMAVVGERSGWAPHLVLELSDALDRSTLATALELLAERHPILGCTADPLAPRARWRPGTTSPQLVWKGLVPEAELDLRSGPTCHGVYETRPGGSRLKFGVHHALADGVGLLVLADDLRQIYRALRHGVAPDVDVDWSPRSTGALLDARGISWPDRLRMAWEAQQRWSALRRSTHADARGAHVTGDDLAKGFCPRSIPASLFDAVVAGERERGWRPNHVVLALLAIAWLRVIGHESTLPSTSSWLVGVNCRRPFGTSRGIGNLSGFEPVCLSDIETRALPDLVDDVRDAFMPFRRLGTGMVGELSAPLVQLAPPHFLQSAIEVAFETRAHFSRSTRIYTALEVPDVLGEWEDAQALAAWCEPARRVSSPYVALVVARFREEITFTPIASPEVLSPTEADSLIVEIRDQVTRLSSLAPV